jgi:hypothetical protein
VIQLSAAIIAASVAVIIAFLVSARGDEAGYRDYRDRYRAMATSLGSDGHMKWAEAYAMTAILHP